MSGFIIEVKHYNDWKMVGKVFPVFNASTGQPENIFYHEESGSQQHHNLQSPGGIDAVVIMWLIQHGVRTVHHYNKTTEKLHIAPTLTIRWDGIRTQQDARDRIFLPESFWPAVPVPIWYSVPWVTKIERVHWDLIEPGTDQIGHDQREAKPQPVKKAAEPNTPMKPAVPCLDCGKSLQVVMLCPECAQRRAEKDPVHWLQNASIEAGIPDGRR